MLFRSSDVGIALAFDVGPAVGTDVGIIKSIDGGTNSLIGLGAIVEPGKIV